jgi:hypothetical protein
MTNVDGCRHIGEQTDKDQTICSGTFKKLNNFDYLKIIGEQQQEQEQKQEIHDNNDIREKRLQYFGKIKVIAT